MSEALTLAGVAAMDRDTFVATFGEVFEHSPWVAEAAWAAGPCTSVEALHAAMMAAVQARPVAQRIAFLNGHPELAGREAEAGTLTGHSTDEQHSAGLDALGPGELAELRRLNAAYRERHGFPFIIAVRGHGRSAIFVALRQRLANATADELGAALDQVARITRGRLDALFAAAPILATKGPSP